MITIGTGDVIIQNMERYVLYIRKSSESEDRQVMSLDAQESEMMRIAKRDAVDIVEVIRESHSAKVTGQRPEFNRMVKNIRSGKYNAILTWAPDRISRNAGDLGLVIDLMDAGKLNCVRTFSQVFANDPNSKFMLMMLGSQAKLENDQKSLNVKRGNREKLKRGDWINSAPFGYLNDKATKTIRVDPVRAPYVSQMFELYASGLYSYKQISNLLYEQGLRTKGGLKVSGGQIHFILKRTFYFGLMESNGKFYKGNHKPLISQELFDKCRETTENKSRPRSKNKGFTLSGFIKCASCGCAATAEKKKGKYIYYHCTNGRGTCNQRSFNTNEEAINAFIAKDMERLQISPKLVDIVYKAKLEEMKQSDEFHSHALESAYKARSLLSERKSRLIDTYTAGDINEDLYREKLLIIDNEHAKMSLQIEKMEKDNQDPFATIELVYSKFKQGYSMSKRYSDASPEEKRIILSEALSNCTLLNRNIAQLQYKSPYNCLVRASVKPSLHAVLPVRDSNPNNILQRDASYH